MIYVYWSCGTVSIYFIFFKYDSDFKPYQITFSDKTLLFLMEKSYYSYEKDNDIPKGSTLVSI